MAASEEIGPFWSRIIAPQCASNFMLQRLYTNGNIFQFTVQFRQRIYYCSVSATKKEGSVFFAGCYYCDIIASSFQNSGSI